MQGIQNSQNNLEKKEQSRSIMHIDFKTYYKPTLIKKVVLA